MQFLRRASWLYGQHASLACKKTENAHVVSKITRWYSIAGGPDGKIQTTVQRHASKHEQIRSQMHKDAEKYLANISETDQKKLKLYKFEHELWYSQGMRVPESLEDWQYAWLLQDCPTYGKR